MTGFQIDLVLNANQVTRFPGTIARTIGLVRGPATLEVSRNALEWSEVPPGSRISMPGATLFVRAATGGSYRVAIDQAIEQSNSTNATVTIDGGTIDQLTILRQISAQVQNSFQAAFEAALRAERERSLDAATVSAIQAAFVAAFQDASVQSALQTTFRAALDSAPIVTTTQGA